MAHPYFQTLKGSLIRLLNHGILESRGAYIIMRIVIDGNIGSGKSTQIELLHKAGFKTKREPIEQWPLDLFYKDPSRWAFLLQMAILKTYTDPDDDCIYERCMQSSKHVFWLHLVMSNLVTAAEIKEYDFWYRKVSWRPDVKIYLHSSPAECYKRIQARGQTGDSGVKFEYIEKIHDYYGVYAYDHHEILVDGKSPEDIHAEILSIIKVENAMYLSDCNRT
jgi:deoxyadenosine/deoxycytidine kinase